MKRGGTVIGFGVLLAVWTIGALVLPDRIFPGPIATSARLVALLGHGLALHLGASLLRLLAAVTGATLIGVPVGLWMGMNARADRVLGPVAYVLYPIPKIALLPVFMLLLGLGNVSKIALVITIIVFQLLLASRDAVREIPPAIMLSARSLDLSRGATYRHVVLPGALPRVYTALRLSVGISFSVIFFSESFATRYGIGYFIMNAWAQVLYVDMFAGILALALVGYLVFRAIDLAQKLTCPWLEP